MRAAIVSVACLACSGSPRSPAMTVVPTIVEDAASSPAPVDVALVDAAPSMPRRGQRSRSA
jgi:hypothetical protein